MQTPNERFLSTDRLDDNGSLLTAQTGSPSGKKIPSTQQKAISNGCAGLSSLVRALCICVCVAIVPAQGRTQEIAENSPAIASSFPDAPVPCQSSGTASVSGEVLDHNQAPLLNAAISLVLADGTVCRSMRSSANGQFTFTDLQGGSYYVTIDAIGFSPYKTQEFTITAHQAYDVPEIILAIASVATTVTVRPTEEIAAEQIRAEEKQRLLGVIPNFYVSYIPDAAPLTAKQKFSLAAHDTLDWTTFVSVSIGAGIQQATNAFNGYGQGAEGYGKRWGALFADGRISDFLSHYVFAVTFHQDPRYFYQGTGTKKSRLYHALGSAFVARGDNGKSMPNYSYLFGDLATGAISNAYYPRSDRGAGLVFTNAGIGLAGRMGQAVVQEFISKRLTHHVPDPGDSGNPPPNSPPKPDR